MMLEARKNRRLSRKPIQSNNYFNGRNREKEWIQKRYEKRIKTNSLYRRTGRFGRNWWNFVSRDVYSK